MLLYGDQILIIIDDIDNQLVKLFRICISNEKLV